MNISEERKYVLTAFAVGLAVRSIPNLIAQLPVGYDTLLYEAQILDWKTYLSNPNILFNSPLFLLLASFFYLATHLNPLTILNIFQPLLYGLLATSFYYASRRILKWSYKWALLATILFLLQTVTLRISWDLLRNELGLSMLLYTLVILKDFERQPLVFTVFSTLVILSHQITAAILLVILLGLMVCNLRKNDHIMTRRLIMYSLPTVLLCLGMLAYAVGFQILPYTTYPSVLTRTIEVPTKRDFPFPFANYLSNENSFINYAGSYVNLLIDFTSLYTASYLPLLPLIILGILSYRKLPVDLWTGLCTVATLTAVISPTFAFIYWERSMMMLIVPYIFYATHGIQTIYNRKISSKSRKILIIATCCIYASIAIPYQVSPAKNPLSLYAALWSSTKYSPATLLRQATPLEDIPSVEKTLKWLNINMEKDSCLITRETFTNWAKIHLKNNETIIDYGVNDVSVGLEYSKMLNYKDIYWIWWQDGIGLKWYGQQIPNEFKPVFRAGEIVIYKFYASIHSYVSSAS